MRKLILALMAVCFSFALATPVFADPVAAPFFNPLTLLLALIILPIIAFILYALLHDRKK